MRSYYDLPFDARDAIEKYVLWGNWAGQCLEALLSISKEREGAARALCIDYGEWYHGEQAAAEKLSEQYGITEPELSWLAWQYWQSRNEEPGKRIKTPQEEQSMQEARPASHSREPDRRKIPPEKREARRDPREAD